MLVLAMSYWLLPPLVWLRGALDPNLGNLTAPALVAVGVSAVFWMVFCHGMRIPALFGLGYPLGALMALYIALRSTWRGGRRVEWRGRVYRDRSVSGEEKRKR
jgi:hypothetical protein